MRLLPFSTAVLTCATWIEVPHPIARVLEFSHVRWHRQIDGGGAFRGRWMKLIFCDSAVS